jgi:hypothetical protein
VFVVCLVVPNYPFHLPTNKAEVCKDDTGTNKQEHLFIISRALMTWVGGFTARSNRAIQRGLLITIRMRRDEAAKPPPPGRVSIERYSSAAETASATPHGRGAHPRFLKTYDFNTAALLYVTVAHTWIFFLSGSPQSDFVPPPTGHRNHPGWFCGRENWLSCTQGFKYGFGFKISVHRFYWKP